MIKNDYRTMVNDVVGPIINYFGFHINPDGLIQKNGDVIDITLSGRHLYIPKDGEDFFNTKDSPLLIPFNPFKIREHTLILSKFFCAALSDHFRDDDDVQEFNSNGELIDIVTLVKRGPKNEDKLPSTFNGVIYEIWCRDEDVLGKGIDHDGNDIKAIIMAMLDTLSRYTRLVPKDINYKRLFNYIARVEAKKDAEIDEARSRYSTTLNAVDLSEQYLDESDIMDKVDLLGGEEIEPSPEEESDDSPEEEPNYPSVHNYDTYDNENAFDDVDLF